MPPRNAVWSSSLVAAILLLTSCETREPVVSGRPRDAVFTEPRPVQKPTASRQLGESCPSGQAAECLSDVCLHTRPEPGVGHYCTQRCDNDAQCPKNWRCALVFPVKGHALCVPPENWTSGLAEPR